MVSILAVVVSHELEDWKLVKLTVDSLSRFNIDAVIVYSRYDAHKLNVPKIIVGREGLGLAREHGYRYAREHGYEYILFTDAHVYFFNDPKPLTNYDWAQPIVTFIDKDEMIKFAETGRLLNLPSPFCAHVPTFYSGDNYFLVKIRTLYMSTEPVQMYKRKRLDELAEIQGEAFPVPGYGKEFFDPTLSLSRLGYVGACIEEVKILHKLNKSDTPEWKNRWNSEQINLWQQGEAYYYFKHYYLSGFRNKLHEYYLSNFPKIPAYKLAGAVEFNRRARYTTMDVYRMIQDTIIRENAVTSDNVSKLWS